MIGSILFVLTFSKSADYSRNFLGIFGIVWELFGNSLGILWEFFGNSLGIVTDYLHFQKFRIWEDIRLNDRQGQGQGQGQGQKRSLEAQGWRLLALKKIFVALKHYKCACFTTLSWYYCMSRWSLAYAPLPSSHYGQNFKKKSNNYETFSILNQHNFNSDTSNFIPKLVFIITNQ